MELKKLDTQNNQTNLENLRILNRVRLIAINGQLALILFAIGYLDIFLPLNWLIALLVCEVAFQIYSYLRVKNARTVSANEIFIHIVIDSLILASLVYFSGGASNPFIYLLLLSIALGTLMLTPRHLLLVATLQLLLYSLLNIYQRPLEMGDSSPLASFHLHLAGMWVNFVMTVILIAVFGLLTRLSLLNQEKKIRQLREKQIKDEQILSLGIMSANAAHQLGTPLATMAIIVDDLNHEDVSERVKNDMSLLAEQIGKCRNIIYALNDRSHYSKSQLSQVADAQPTLCIKKQLETIAENWMVFRPQIILEKHWGADIDKIFYKIPISVEQALTNLLDNAADASLENQKDKVSIDCCRKQQSLIIEISDYGQGLSPELKESLGASIQKTEKRDGLGWGVFLSNASIERAGGKVQLIDASNGGTITRVVLPLGELV